MSWRLISGTVRCGKHSVSNRPAHFTFGAFPRCANHDLARPDGLAAITILSWAVNVVLKRVPPDESGVRQVPASVTVKRDRALRAGRSTRLLAHAYVGLLSVTSEMPQPRAVLADLRGCIRRRATVMYSGHQKPSNP